MYIQVQFSFNMTVVVVLSDPSLAQARFTTVPFKHLSDKIYENYRRSASFSSALESHYLKQLIF